MKSMYHNNLHNKNWLLLLLLSKSDEAWQISSFVTFSVRTRYAQKRAKLDFRLFTLSQEKRSDGFWDVLWEMYARVHGYVCLLLDAFCLFFFFSPFDTFVKLG